MDLFETISQQESIRGITLNSQNIDLFNIIRQTENHEDTVEKIYNYLNDLLQARQMSKEMHSQRLSTTQKIKKVVNEKASDGIDKEDFYKFLSENAMQIKKNWHSKEKLEDLFADKQINSSYIDEILNIKKYFTYQTHGILTFLVNSNGETINPDSTEFNIDKEKTFDKVHALYDYVTGNLKNGEKRFTRLTLDGQGKFGTVAGIVDSKKESQTQPRDYNLDPLKQGYEFAKTNDMNEVYINALVFFKDFPDRLVGGTKEQYITALTNYGKAIASVANEYENQGLHTVIDMFNEFVDYNEPFLERTNNWMSKLNIEDLCEIALTLKRKMPNVDFGYNDWNFENPDKRKAIFDVISKIQTFEKQNTCKILDHIGTQCHTSINDIDGLRKSIEEIQQFGLPIDITELDISKKLDDVDYEIATPEELNAIRKYEQKLQNDIMKMLSEFVKDGKIRCITSWSITDELCCDFCDGKEASVTGMTYDKNTGFSFFGKDMDKEIEMTYQEMTLIKNHREKIKDLKNKDINQNPTQDFCFHTHTQRCGHGAKDTGDEEWVQHAIKGGLKKLAFTDHIPLPDGYNHKPNSRMDIAELDSYLDSIHYLQEKYKGQIDIESGFEFEYSDRDLTHLKQLKAKTDKMILGQHFVIDTEGKEYKIAKDNDGNQINDSVLDMYAASIITAMEQEIPDVIAHPDLFMQARDNFGEKEEQITRAICKKAIEKGVPLEINFGKIAPKIKSEMSIDEIKRTTPYPSTEFWKIVADETKIAHKKGQDLLVVFGKDAHFPEQLSTEKDYEIAKTIIGSQTLDQLHLVSSYKDLENKSCENIIAALTFQEIGRGTTKQFCSNPTEADKAIAKFEAGAKLKKRNKRGTNSRRRLK